MHLSKALPDAVSLYHDDFEWIQSIDYEHVPFRCRKCHALGYLFRDFPLNMKPPTSTSSKNPDSDGFTKVNNCKKNHKKPTSNPKNPSANTSMPSTSNSFKILAQPDSNTNEIPLHSEESPKASSQFIPISSEQPQKHMQSIDLTTFSPNLILIWKSHGMEVDILQQETTFTTETIEERSEAQHMEEEPESIDIGDLDIFVLEQACRKKEFDKIPERQLENLEVILSRAQQQRTLGIQPESQWDGKNIPKYNKKRGRKTDLQRTICIWEMLVESRRYSKLTKYYSPLPYNES